MACPDCGSPLGEFRSAISIETHGLGCGPFERFEDEYIVCRECGGQFDVSDWDSSDLIEQPPLRECGGDTPPAQSATVAHVELLDGGGRLPQEEIYTWPD